MKDTDIIEPLLNSKAELIIEIENDELYQLMILDVQSMEDSLREQVLSSMLSMHKYYENECGDLEVSLNTNEEIIKNTESWYVILDSSSNIDQRAVRYHYKANWETSHGVEVIILNGKTALFVGNCGYASSIDRILSGTGSEFNFISRA